METGYGPGGGGQTSLKLMDGRSLAPWCHSCTQLTFGLTLALSWRTGLGLISAPFRDPVSGLISAPFRRRFRDSILLQFGGGFGTHFGAELERLKYLGK